MVCTLSALPNHPRARRAAPARRIAGTDPGAAPPTPAGRVTTFVPLCQTDAINHLCSRKALVCSWMAHMDILGRCKSSRVVAARRIRIGESREKCAWMSRGPSFM